MIDKLVNAVLYEGYILYPYRLDSTKNRHRFTFGRVYPQAFSVSQQGAEPCTMQTQCLLEKTDDSTLTIALGFLHPMQRVVNELPEPTPHWTDESTADLRPVPELRVDGRLYQTWQEAVEQKLTLAPIKLDEASPQRFAFLFAASQQREPIRDDRGRVVGVIERRRDALEGTITVAIDPLDETLLRATVRVTNATPLDAASSLSTEDDPVLLKTFVSTHLILSVHSGAFISLLDPPSQVAEAAANCQNEGVFPVLVGEVNQRDMLLASPIILYDYPEIAPESQGDLFDGTEIDEMLTLRILTMTDAEKAEMRQVDERARQILQRTEAMHQDERLRLHGARRSLRALGEDES